MNASPDRSPDTSPDSEPTPDGGCVDPSVSDSVTDHSVSSHRQDKSVNTHGQETPAERDAFLSTLRIDVHGLLRHVRTIAAVEYRLAIRNQWAFALAGLFALFGGMLLMVSGASVGPDGFQRVIASLTSLSVYLIPLAALAFGYDSVVGREEQGWLAMVFALPLTRARVVFGTYLGRAIVFAGAVVIGFGFTGFLLFREYGTVSWGTFPAFLGATIGVGSAFLAIAVLLSTIAGEKTHALGLALLVWVWFVLIHDLVALGIVSAFALPDVALTALVVANPTSVYRVLVLIGLETTAGGGFTAAMAGTALSIPVLTLALIAWTVGPIAIATGLISRRRL